MTWKKKKNKHRMIKQTYHMAKVHPPVLDTDTKEVFFEGASHVAECPTCHKVFYMSQKVFDLIPYIEQYAKEMNFEEINGPRAGFLCRNNCNVPMVIKELEK
jgi:hypothetical protein